LAYIPQSSSPVYDYTALDTVLMGTTSSLGFLESPGKKEEEEALTVLEDLGIGYLKDRGIARISGGEQQLVYIARALIQKAKILIMDEPTANLDYGNQYRVMDKVRSLSKEGYTILLSTHNPEHALLYADKVLILKDGKVLTQGKKDEVLTEQVLSDLYGIPIGVEDVSRGGKNYKVCLPL